MILTERGRESENLNLVRTAQESGSELLVIKKH